MLISCIPIGMIASPQSQLPDSISNINLDSLSIALGDTLIYNDTIIGDTIIATSITGDTVIVEAEVKTRIDAKVERFARDSIVQDIANRKVFLFGEAVVNYQDITLKANYIEVDLSNNTVFAAGIEDSTGKMVGLPEFTQGDQTFKSNTMTYNFDTKKGMITNVVTEDGNGFLHGETVKKLDDNTVNILHGEYTTCNLEENPHFGFKFKKSRVIPDSKIVTGPAYMEIEQMPTPLGLPFGFFPNKTGQTSGIVIPTFGEYTNRGFYLEDGGYYWAINEYMDFQVLGDIYSRGGWGVKPRFRYKKRYKFSGDFNLGYAENVIGTKGAPDYEKSTDFKVRWSHRQDPKARPNSTFSADVNIVSGNYVKYNVVSTEDFLSNEFQSSVAYQKNWGGKYFLTLNASHRQNTKTHKVDVSLPEMTFTVNRFYPLKKEGGGKKRFYEDLSVSYSMNSKNQISTYDSIFFDAVTIENNMQAGAVHKIPISLPLKVLKYFTLSNSFNITDRMYSRTINKSWDSDTIVVGTDTIAGSVAIDTVNGFRNSLDYNFSSSLSTKVFGMVGFKKGPIRAIRHVLTPSINFSYTPEFGKENLNYWDTYVDGNGNDVRYSHFEGSLYGGPSDQESGRIGLSLANNLEIKVPSKKDTITGLRKIKLIESFTISGNYDLAKDSLNMSMITMSGRTTLWKNFSVQYGSVWDPYATDSLGSRINKFEWEVNRRFLRLDQTTWRLSFGFKLGDTDFKKEKPENVSDDQMNQIVENSDGFVDWSIPWSIDMNYNFTYTNNLEYINWIKVPTKTIVQTLSFRGQVNITPKWKFTFNSGWDFTQNKLSYTTVNLYRDLHCWEMRFSWTPLGVRQSWNFSINVKASILQDLKLNKKKDFRDY